MTQQRRLLAGLLTVAGTLSAFSPLACRRLVPRIERNGGRSP